MSTKTKVIIVVVIAVAILYVDLAVGIFNAPWSGS